MKGTNEDNNTYGFIVNRKRYNKLEDIPRRLPKNTIVYSACIAHDARTKQPVSRASTQIADALTP